jgi:hypothetical protein
MSALNSDLCGNRHPLHSCFLCQRGVSQRRVRVPSGLRPRPRHGSPILRSHVRSPNHRPLPRILCLLPLLYYPLHSHSIYSITSPGCSFCDSCEASSAPRTLLTVILVYKIYIRSRSLP